VWFHPRTGEAAPAGSHPGTNAVPFAPPGASAPGNDWVLVLDAATKHFKAPGAL